MTRAALSVVCLLEVRFDEDVAADCVRAWLTQGVEVYVLSRLGGGRAAGLFAAFHETAGFLGVEECEDVDPDAGISEAVLERKEVLARTLDADWFVHGHADEFCESAWDGPTIVDGIRRVDALGYNAIAFHVLNFLPTTADLTEEADVRNRMRHYNPSWIFNEQVVICWKKMPAPVALASSAGVAVQFEGQRVFPIPFLLRRYPIRPAATAPSSDRDGRSPAEVSGIRDPASLVRDDPEQTRLGLWLRHRDVSRLERMVDAGRDVAEDLRADRQRLQDDNARLHAQVAAQAQTLANVFTSRSWRLTAPLRAIDRLFRRR